MKTAHNFHRKVKIDRYMTLGPDSSPLHKKPSFKELVRERIKTVISKEDDDDDDFLPIQSSPNIIDANKEETEEDVLTSQFAAEWARYTAYKRETYLKLRNQFVKQFPSYRAKYKEGQIDNELPPLVTEPSPETRTISRTAKSSHDVRSSLLVTSNRKSSINNNKASTFYSRSKKKCISDIYPHCSQEQQKPQPEVTAKIPRLSFLAYKKHPAIKNKLRGQRLKDMSLIKGIEGKGRDRGARRYLMSEITLGRV